MVLRTKLAPVVEHSLAASQASSQYYERGDTSDLNPITPMSRVPEYTPIGRASGTSLICHEFTTPTRAVLELEPGFQFIEPLYSPISQLLILGFVTNC